MSTSLVPTSPNDLALCARNRDALTKAPVGGWSTHPSRVGRAVSRDPGRRALRPSRLRKAH